MTIEELKAEKLKMETDIANIITKFIYDTNTVVTDINVVIKTARSFTDAVVLTEKINVKAPLEI